MVNVKNFPSVELETIGQNRFKSLRLLSIYGFEAKDVLFITNEDKVYCFGQNRFGALGLGHKEENIESIQFNAYLSGQEVIDLSFGSKHWIALTSSGQCYVWGDNTFGQLGVKHVDNTLHPRLTEVIDSNVVKVSCGNNHSLALTSEGLLYGWGHNKFGQLADNKSDKHPKPIQMDISEPIKSIACGLNHSMALTSSGKVFIWGLANEGRLGICSNFRYYEPQLVNGLENQIIKQMVCGPNHSLLLSNDGHIYAFGDNSSGQIGNGSVDTQYSAFKVKSESTFKKVIANKVNDLSVGITTDDKYYIWGLTEAGKYLTPKEVIQELSCSSFYDIYAKYAKIKVTFNTITLKSDQKRLVQTQPKFNLSDKVWQQIQTLNQSSDTKKSTSNSGITSVSTISVKNNSEPLPNPMVDQLTIDNYLTDICKVRDKIKIKADLKKKIRLMNSGYFNRFIIFITTEDKVYCNGWNGYGCLGLGDHKNRMYDIVLNEVLSGKQLVDIASGFTHCIGLTRNGQCYAWGKNDNGELGLGNNLNYNTPQLIGGLKEEVVVQISCGAYHTLAMTIDGEVFAWGQNRFGLLADKTYADSNVPKKVIFDTKSKIVSICSSKVHSLALDANGQLFVWGINENGQLGRPRDKDKPHGRKATCNRPFLLKELKNIRKAVCGAKHTLLLTNNGRVYAFGKNDCGQVGNGTNNDQLTPFDLKNRMKIKDIICCPANDLSLAISEDNRYYIWGSVGNEKVLRPKLVIVTNERSVYDIYINCANSRILFKTLVVNEDSKYCINCQVDSRSKSLTESKCEYVCSVRDDKSDRQLSDGNDNGDHDMEIVDSIFNIVHKDAINNQINANLNQQLNASNLSINTDLQSLKTSMANMSLSNTLKNRLKESFNNPNDSDLKFIFDDQILYCQKGFIKFRNKKFWQKVKQTINDKNEIIISSLRFEVMQAFVRYLYELEPELSDATVFALQSMAKIFDEKELMDQCSQYIKHLESGINLSNVCSLYEKAITMGLTDLEKCCVEFASNNSLLTRLITSATKFK